jgi:hypothetical protein
MGTFFTFYVRIFSESFWYKYYRVLALKKLRVKLRETVKLIDIVIRLRKSYILT